MQKPLRAHALGIAQNGNGILRGTQNAVSTDTKIR